MLLVSEVPRQRWGPLSQAIIGRVGVLLALQDVETSVY